MKTPWSQPVFFFSCQYTCTNTLGDLLRAGFEWFGLKGVGSVVWSIDVPRSSSSCGLSPTSDRALNTSFATSDEPGASYFSS